EVGPVEIVLKHPGYRDYVYSGKVSEGEHTINAVLLEDRGPVPGQAWRNALGIEFGQNSEGAFVSLGEISMKAFGQYLEETGQQIPVVGVEGVAQVQDDAALWGFCDWLTRRDRSAGYLGPDRYH